LKPIVGTTNMSTAAIPAAWLRRKVVQFWPGRRGRPTMYLATVDWATSMPSLSNSPWIRSAPHNQLARLISSIKSRISLEIAGRPPLDRDFQRQKTLNPCRCQRITVSGLMIATTFTTLGQNR
jgi:hypothetical protein